MNSNLYSFDSLTQNWIESQLALLSAAIAELRQELQALQSQLNSLRNEP